MLEGFSCHKTKLLVPLASWPKRLHGNPQTTQAVTKIMDCSPYSVDKDTLMQKIPTQLIEYGEFKLAAT